MEKMDTETIEAAIDAAAAGESGSQGESQGAGEGEAKAEQEQGAEIAEAQGGEEKDAGEEKPEPFAPDDALVERAVKAGLSLADARSFTSKDSMERILSALEATASKPTEKADAHGDGDSAGGEGSAQEALAQIPELSADEGYDEGLVAAFNGLRKLAIQQSETIAKLARAGETARAKDRFTELCGTLDESVQKGMDAATRSHLKKQYDILAAGYKATGTERKDADIFAEAAKLAIGDRLKESAASKRADALERRKNLALAKPGGEGGAGKGMRTAGGDDDPAAIAAAEIRQELGL